MGAPVRQQRLRPGAGGARDSYSGVSSRGRRRCLPPPPLAGTLVLRCSCWPSPAAVGVQPLERDTRLRARAARRFWDLRGLEAPARPGLARGSKGRWTCSEDLADLGPGRAGPSSRG